MRVGLAAAVALANTPGALAETVFAVTTEDIVECRALSEFSGHLADLRNTGAGRAELARAFPADFSPALKEDLLDIVFGLTSGDSGFVMKVTGALCLMERLEPKEAR